MKKHFVVFGLIIVLALPAYSQTKKVIQKDSSALRTGTIYVRDYGAKGDGKIDDTLSIQSALNTMGKLGGGIVDLGIGNYLCKGHLDIPENVTLRGIWQIPTARTENKGSTLLVTEGKDKRDGDPFIMMHQNSTIKGLTIYYPEQDKGNIHAYPWTVRGLGDDISVVDILMVNPYQAVDFGTMNCGRHYIHGLYANALYRGIFVDKCFDVGRIENVHFWPFWGDDKRVNDFTTKYGEAFIFGRTDWEYVSNSFCILYKTGFRFIANKEYGPGNVLISQSGSDVGPCGVHVEDSQAHAGISFNNCQFMAGVVVDSTNRGPIKFTSCGFWGVDKMTQEHGLLHGTGLVSYSNCHFVSWDSLNEGKYCINADCTALTINACEFLSKDKKYIRVGPDTKSVIITSNRFEGEKRFLIESKGDVQIGFNTFQ